MSIESVERKKIVRAIKGKVIAYVYDEIIQGDNRGNERKKPIHENVLNDVLQLRQQRKTPDEIHVFGHEKYSFREDNPWENRYFKYIEENRP